MPKKELFDKLIGKWEGDSQTWFEPGKLADESKVTGEFVDVLDGLFLRHTYEGTMQGKPRRGEELIAFNSITKSFQVSWVDDFHMNDAIMFSHGESTERGFNVRGEYDVGEDHPKWGWRTEYKLIDDNHLTITAYNIDPEGMEAKAVETKYERANQVTNQVEHDRRIDYVEFSATGIDEVKRFYSEVFGWEFTDYGPDYTSFSDGRLGGGFTVSSEITGGGPLVVLFSANLEEIEARIGESGGRIVRKTFEFPGGRRFHFTDPSGNELAVWSDR